MYPHVTLLVSQNRTIERLWVAVNARINYPVKAVLFEMLESSEISTENVVTQYCLSLFTSK